jgi:4-hydroxyphenylpyruvate dioxygenase
LETGSREIVTHVVKQNDVRREHLETPNLIFQIIFAFTSALNPTGEVAERVGNEIKLHGDGAKDVAFRVDNCRAIYHRAIERGAVSVQEPTELKDENGVVVVATIQTVSMHT